MRILNYKILGKAKAEFNKVSFFLKICMRTYVFLNNELECLFTGVLMMIVPFKVKIKFCNRTINLEYHHRGYLCLDGCEF